MGFVPAVCNGTPLFLCAFNGRFPFFHAASPFCSYISFRKKQYP
jgi:hypothetical protein